MYVWWKIPVALALCGGLAGCVTTQKVEPAPAQMVLDDTGNLVTMLYQTGAPFASIYETPRAYCAQSGKKEVQLDYPNDYTKPDRVAVFYCSSGTADDQSFIADWKQRRVAEYNRWLSTRQTGKPMSIEEQRRVAAAHIARARESAAGYATVERNRPCNVFTPGCSVGAPAGIEAIRPLCTPGDGAC